MLDVLKNRLIDGLKIVSIKEMRTKYEIEFDYEGDKGIADLPKRCALGCQNKVADHTIKMFMSTVYIARHEYAKAKERLNK